MKNAKKRTVIHYLPVYGCIATGILYASIGVIAILSFLKLRYGGADEASMMAILAEYVVGKIVICILLLGTLCYIAWRFYETITDPYEYGNNWQGGIKRAGIALSTIADILIVYAAVKVLLGLSQFQPSGQPHEEQAMVYKMLKNQGQWPVMAIGFVYMITAVIQLWYGITKGYRERVDIERFSSVFRNAVHILAWAGYAGRGIILGIIGFFFLKAGITENARYVVNTDKAFDFIGDHVGHVYFILVAIATICYGTFMFVQGIAYDTDKD
jgi:heme/copper-type cytochrome/quinol oxidase subunit 2